MPVALITISGYPSGSRFVKTKFHVLMCQSTKTADVIFFLLVTFVTDKLLHVTDN